MNNVLTWICKVQKNVAWWISKERLFHIEVLALLYFSWVLSVSRDNYDGPGIPISDLAFLRTRSSTSTSIFSEHIYVCFCWSSSASSPMLWCPYIKEVGRQVHIFFWTSGQQASVFSGIAFHRVLVGGHIHLHFSCISEYRSTDCTACMQVDHIEYMGARRRAGTDFIGLKKKM